MPTMSSVFGLVLPDDLPVHAYDAIYTKTKVGRKAAPALAPEFAGAWRAVGYRLLACSEHGAAFTRSIVEHGHTPPLQQRYEQERELFNFFVNGLSAVESLYYALHAIAGMMDPRAFPMGTVKQKKAVTPERTTSRFEARFPGDELTLTLRRFLDDPAYERWDGVRNILAHRLTLGRVISVNLGSPEDRTARYQTAELPEGTEDIHIDDGTTSTRLEWLITSLANLLLAAEAFLTRHDHLLQAQAAAAGPRRRLASGGLLASAIRKDPAKTDQPESQ